MIKIFVAQLSYDTQSEDLEDTFAELGAVSSANVILDRDTGRSRGFGFVEMDDDDAARKAIEDLDGTELDGRQIVVKEARPREDRGNNRGGGNRGGGGNRW